MSMPQTHEHDLPIVPSGRIDQAHVFLVHNIRLLEAPLLSQRTLGFPSSASAAVGFENSLSQQFARMEFETVALALATLAKSFSRWVQKTTALGLGRQPFASFNIGIYAGGHVRVGLYGVNKTFPKLHAYDGVWIAILCPLFQLSIFHGVTKKVGSSSPTVITMAGSSSAKNAVASGFGPGVLSLPS